MGVIPRGWTIAIAVISDRQPILVRSLHLLVYIILLSHEDPSGDRQSKSCHGTGDCKEDRPRSGAQRAGKCEVSVQTLESSATVHGGFRMARNPEATLDRHTLDSP